MSKTMELAHTTRAQWFAVQTRYRYEQRIANDLSAKGLENYLPTMREVHEWQDRKKLVEVPAFGGYLFVRFEATQQNRVRVLETAGVVRLVGNQGQLEAVPDSEIEALRLSLTSGARCTRYPCLAVGTLLRIERGPLSGLEGRLVCVANALRLVICIASVGQAIAVEVDRDDVSPIEAAEASFGDRLHSLESSACELMELPAGIAQQEYETGAQITSAGIVCQLNR
jgi:transcription antitermination factor NusG